MKKRIIVSWSSGKDATLTLCRLLKDDFYQVVGLFTTHVKGVVPFQFTPIEIVKAQADAAGLPLVLIELDDVFMPNVAYQQKIIAGIIESGLNVDAVAFGDMFCNGIESYRQSYIEPQGWDCVFPLMGESSYQLAKEIIQIGIEAHITMVDTSQLDPIFLARNYDLLLLSELPTRCDPCGENGEFHTLVTDAPCFSAPLSINVVNEIHQGRFHHLAFCMQP